MFDIRPTIVGVVALSLVTACSADGDEDSGEPGSPESIKALSEEARELGYTEQYEALRDGAVTEAEYREARQRVAACAEKAGMTVEGELSLDPMDQIQLTGYSFGKPAGMSIEEFEATLNQCEARHEGYVAPAYMLSKRPQIIDGIRKPLYECLEDRGFELTGDEISEQDFRGVTGQDGLRDYVECASEAGRKYLEATGQYDPESLDEGLESLQECLESTGFEPMVDEISDDMLEHLLETC